MVSIDWSRSLGRIDCKYFVNAAGKVSIDWSGRIDCKYFINVAGIVSVDWSRTLRRIDCKYSVDAEMVSEDWSRSLVRIDCKYSVNAAGILSIDWSGRIDCKYIVNAAGMVSIDWSRNLGRIDCKYSVNAAGMVSLDWSGSLGRIDCKYFVNPAGKVSLDWSRNNWNGGFTEVHKIKLNHLKKCRWWLDISCNQPCQIWPTQNLLNACGRWVISIIYKIRVSIESLHRMVKRLKADGKIRWIENRRESVQVSCLKLEMSKSGKVIPQSGYRLFSHILLYNRYVIWTLHKQRMFCRH